MKIYIVQFEEGGIPEEPEVFLGKNTADEYMSNLLVECGFPRLEGETPAQHVQAYKVAMQSWQAPDEDVMRENTYRWHDVTIRGWELDASGVVADDKEPEHDGICDTCGRTGVEIAHTDTDGKTVCVDCDESDDGWRIIPDERVRHIWMPVCGCEETDGQTVEVSPDYYATNGEPCCGCGEDYEYQYTEILPDEASDAREVARLMQALEHAWGLIANAGGGAWENEQPMWRNAAMTFRDEDWHPALDRNGYAGSKGGSCDPCRKDVEMRKTVVLSTAHLTEETREAASRMCCGDDHDQILYPYTYGYMAYAYPERTALLPIPDDFWACCEWANANVPKQDETEAIYINFDVDGPVMEGLPTYDGTE